MKILHIWSFFNTELKYHVNYLAEEMTDSLGHSVSILSCNKVRSSWKKYVSHKSLKDETVYLNKVKLIRIKTINLLDKPIPYDFSVLRAVAREENADVLHLFSLSSVFNYVCLSCLNRYHRKPFVVVASDHSNPSNQATSSIGAVYHRLFRKVFGLYENQIQRIYVPNEATESLIKKRYALPEGKVKVIPLGYDERIFNSLGKHRNTSNKLIVGFAGKVNSAKRLEVLFDAIQKTDVAEDIEYIVAGVVEDDEYTQGLCHYAQRLAIKVEMRPMLDAHELAELYSYVDVAVFPGSISITTLEATGCGTPIILYESIGGLNDRVEGGRGKLFSEFDELVHGIQHYFASKMRRQIDHGAIEAASKRHSWSEIARWYEREYCGLLTHEIR